MMTPQDKEMLEKRASVKNKLKNSWLASKRDFLT